VLAQSWTVGYSAITLHYPEPVSLSPALNVENLRIVLPQINQRAGLEQLG
jgi:hypothetical protein